MKTFAVKITILTLTLLLGVLFSSYSQTEEDQSLSPYFFVQSDDPALDKLPLKSTNAWVVISGVIADITVTQVYKNEGTRPIEAIYVFPGSTRAAVYAMKMTIGERTILAKIEEREKARQDYEQARQNGQSASLLEQQRPNVFQMNVANIMPGDEIKVEMKYTELLMPDEGVYEFVYPTVVGPRYSNKLTDLADSNEKWVANPYTKEGELPFYSFDIDVHLKAGMPVKDVICSSHETNIQFLNPDEVKIELKDAEKYGGNRDFILKYRLRGEQIESGLLLYEGEKENFFLLMVQPPKQVKPEHIPPREYIFIVDVSGSMMGFPLDVSKSLLKDLIGNLRPTDRFNILLFAGGSSLFSESSLNANETNIKSAIGFLNKQSGGGGTELLPALKRALALQGTEDYARTFIIATDGYVNVEKEAYDLIRSNLGTANFFTFGIGSSVNRFLIEGMTHVGKGFPFVATNQADALQKSIKFRKYISNPVLTNIKVEFKGFDVYDLESVVVPDVFSERPVLIYGKYQGGVFGSIELTGKTGDKDFLWNLDIKKYTRDRSNSGLQYLWARERIRILDDYSNLAMNDNHKSEITALGLKYDLLTAYTSFIAIDSEIRNESGNSTTVNQLLPLPEGVSNNALGYGSASAGIMSRNGRSPNVMNKSMANLIAVNESIEFDMEINDESIFSVMETSPKFKNGEEAFREFLRSNLNYPEEAKTKGIEGTVYVEFIVNEDGSIDKITIVRSVSKLLDEEALRVIKLTNGKWIPGSQRGKLVKVSMTIPVKFKL
ncbi:MAG: TonB family protein [Bacteroidales bacterium]|nr:TonB family protein [Bacteroidales bacterium]